MMLDFGGGYVEENWVSTVFHPFYLTCSWIRKTNPNVLIVTSNADNKCGE